MCGITGFATRDEAAFASMRDNVARAATKLRHRGPDDQGIDHLRSNEVWCALGHTRLAVIDTSAAGHQPMRSGDGRYTIVLNGEIFNFSEMRAELELLGVRFRSTSDTEVLVEAYAKWGAAALERARGMFALAIFDQTTGELLLARDSLGVKPLYIADVAGGVAFASEVRALLALGAVRRRISPSGLAGFLLFGSVPGPDTLVDGIRSLEPGHILRVRRGGSSTTPFWRFPAAAHEASPREHTATIRQRLLETIRMQLVSDVPLGIFLSGGIDSTAIVALTRAVTDGPIHTFNIAFRERKYDESAFARSVAERYRCEHHDILLEPSEALGSLDDLLYSLDQPSADGINSFVVSRAVRRAGITVALSGLGGDEIFGGYDYFQSFGAILKWRWMLRAAPLLGGVLSSALARHRMPTRTRKAVALLRTGGDATEIYGVLRSMFTREQVHRFVGASAPQPASPACAAALPWIAAGDAINAFAAFDATNYMLNTLLRDTDTMSMAHALEVRVPLLDHRVVEAAMGVPGHVKIQAGRKKSLLVDAVGGFPLEVERRPKMGFTLPLDGWFRGPLRKDLERRLRDSDVLGGILNRHSIRSVWDDFLAGEKYASHQRVWSLVSLLSWCRKHDVAGPT